MFDFEQLTSDGLLNEWYAIPVIVLLIIIKVFAEKKYTENLEKPKKKKKEDKSN